MLVSGIKAFGSGRTWKTMLRHILFIFRMLALSCIIVAMARPQTGEQQVTGRRYSLSGYQRKYAGPGFQ
jgi:hypothetical protein